MFKKLWLKIKGFFLIVFGGAKKFEKFLADHADDAIDIVENIKSFVESPAVLTLISIFPKYEKRAKEFLDKMQAVLDEILSKLEEGKACMSAPEFVDRLKCIVEALRKKTPEEQQAVYRNMATHYLMIQSRAYTKDGSEMPESLARSIAETRYASKVAEKRGIAAATVV